jgi:ABC-type antimicrobial peptide transport system permease subunit
VAVVTEAMARRYWPGESPVGARLSIMGMDLEVVGVAADSRLHGFASAPPTMVYGIFPTLPSGDVDLVLRGPGVDAALRTIRDVTRSVDARLVVADVSTGPQLVDSLLAPQRVGGVVFLLFGALAVALSLTGVYGVVAFGVGARAREFGVRLTLGAAPGRVTGEVLRRNLAPVLGGTVVGVAAALALTRVAAAFLFGVSPGDALPAILAAALVLAMSLLATWIPARRAGRVDPAAILAAE